MDTIDGKNSVTAKTYTKNGLLKVIDALPLAIAVIDKDISVVLANQSIYQYTSKKEVQLLGQVGGKAFGCINSDESLGGCGFGEECFKCTLRNTVQETMKLNKAQKMIEAIMVFKTQGKRHLRISTSPLTLDGDDVVLLAIEDITQFKEQEKIKLEKEKLSAVIQTAGAVCHEINQPLMVIMGFSEILLDDLPESDSQNENIKEIKKQAEKLCEITKKLMTITEYKTKDYLNSEILDIEGSSKKDNPLGKERILPVCRCSE